MPASSAFASPLVYTVVLNWNGADDTLECLDSLAALDYANNRVLVVDNASTDGSVERIRERWPELELIEAGVNGGFGAGNNLGIRRALEAGAGYVWVLNNDAVVTPGSLTALVHALESRPRVAAVTPKVLFKECPDRIWHAGGFLDRRLARVVHRGIDRPDRGRYDSEELVTFASGCALLLRAEAVREAGVFDERYFMYWEDVDLCDRLTRAGWQLLYQPAVAVYHKGSSSSGEGGAKTALFDYYNLRNWLWYQREHLHGLARLPALAYTGVVVAGRVAYLLLREPQKLPKLRAIARGARDGLLSRP